MKLTELLSGYATATDDIDIAGLALDSRQVRPGDAFIALNGSNQHGLTHAGQALINGAIAIVYDPAGRPEQAAVTAGITAVAVAGLSESLGDIAARFYQKPSDRLTVIGVTGTNGKTTCSQLIAQALDACGVIGTLGWGEVDNLQPTANTTPDALAVQQMLAELLRRNKRAVAMEVSSHGLEQGRVNGVTFAGAVFTNLSRDHLDYHGTMADYLQAKLKLFGWPTLQFAVVNLDDACSAEVLASIAPSATHWTYSKSGKTLADAHGVVAENIEYHADGIAFDAVYQKQRLRAVTDIAGDFNLENLLAVLCVLLATGHEFASAVAKLADLRAIAGRMERFGGQDKPTVFVDYAHSPDALEKVLRAVKGARRLKVVFGCGGDRDKGKRPQMGRIAETWADQVIVTDDNPRHEASADIIKDILSGCESQKITVINDRATAIVTTIQQAEADDCIVVAGKGHEDYQDIAGVKWPFSDQAVVRQALAEWRAP
ncbi:MULTISPECIES: UDP-N-acetylmuramoyl-L-alanyl-D-glutamate--2,6-diaminopimelate ligase [Methylomonas]|uniref:UDP-N-acetylmuramoyl-L-alanyl-D-glutamate--2,6-diaminopimelate ligase n=1 Tax=Methylomonas koyamae TaxID=702114 RepID=A0A177NNX3_9GAMM|nr:UDP-N-acetylmuramoyl-L-alanyl-D-glutamate--2,6-diaminopimelate ligase [Methylomonas koyamae]OAI18740.1 UDP-N-acetylmuramoyl-L-alanyl-D-glutamate--2,6-diaminopimelate ligase [Methylomonas koyamae]